MSLALLVPTALVLIGLVVLPARLRALVVAAATALCFWYLAVVLRRGLRARRAVVEFYAKRMSLPLEDLYEQAADLRSIGITVEAFDRFWRRLAHLLGVDPRLLRLEDDLYQYPWFNEKEETFSPEEPEDLVLDLAGTRSTLEHPIPSTLEGIVRYAWCLRRKNASE